MQQKKSISVARKGMNRDANASDLKNTEYTLGVNINSNSETGDSYTITNEPSNYFGVQFPESYRVISFINNPLKSRTYFFLSSIESNENSVNFKRSSIGYSDNTITEIYNQDEECGDCGNEKNILSTPLEDIVQAPSNTYVELLNDKCVALADIEEKGLNFNINFPIKKIEIKQEKLGTTLYWNDNRNPFRYLQIGRIEEALENETFDYLHSEDIACEDPQETPCLDVDKLLVNPKHSRLRIEADKEQTGGNLKQGTYEFWGAYCDAYGNETTEYSTPTNPISIWDENNYIQAQTETDDFTNFAIKLKVTNLDKDTFKYYKIAVVERNNVNNTQSVFLAGIYPTTDDIVVYTHSGSSNDDLYITRGNISLKKRMDFSTLTAIKPQYIKAKGTMTSDDRLWAFGLEEEQEINIQPVVNLFSGLVKAQTSAVSENLYKSAIATSKYKQYPRNEVQPLAIRLLYDDGGYSAAFPFVGRPKDSNDAQIIADANINKASLIASENACNENTRQEKWQIFNTASEINAESCFDLDANSIELPPQELEKICYVEIETTIPTNTITLDLTDTFYDLESYVEDNPSLVIPEITPYLEATYLESCTPSYVGDCTTPVLGSQEVEIDEVINEVQTFNYKENNEYLMTVPPQLCNPYKRNTTTGDYLLDTEIDSTLIPCLASVRRELYLRDSGFQNENCAYATELPLQINPSSSFSSVFFNYEISDTLANLLVDNSTLTTTNTATGFNATIHNKAQFFRIEKKGRAQVILEITKKSNCIGEGDLFDFINNNQLRYTVYNNCSGTTELAGDIVDVSTGYLITLDTTNYPDTFYVVIDAKIETIEVPYDCGTPLTTRPVYFVSPPCSCIGIYQRDVEVKSVTVEWDSITMRKKMTYTASCVTYLPKVNDCDPIPYKKYKMAYWESVNDYPDNKQLYDSSTLLIRRSDLSLLTESDKLDFEEYFTEGLNFNGVYELKPTTDLRCQPIRHPKFPDNTVSPFMIDNINHAESADSIIFPMGINLDSKIVQTMIEVAYNNKFLTKKQKEKIVGWEILRGDNSIHKSVTSSGILYDLYKYEKKNDSIYFSNFPFNDLGENKFVKDPTTKQLIQHPFGGESNNKFTYLSPDMFLTKPQIPTEMSLQGYMFGSADMGFADVEKHPQWTVLGNRTYKTAETLAISELVLETIIKLADYSKEGWATFGLSNGGNYGWIGAVAVVGETLASAALKLGEYRYNWLQIFRNLGRADNFASFQYGAGKHNRLLKIDNEDSNYLRRLTLRKHLREGNYTFTDENNGRELRINNDSREHSVLLSTGNFAITYPNDYINFDNNKLSSTSSNFLASETGCDNDERNIRNIANPYVQLKNYVPDQWDTIDSIKWLTTNYIFDLQEDTECKPIYGGTQVISRFSWRIKVPFFRDNAIKLADKLPYLYSKNSNIGDTRFFCNYETAEDSTFNFGTVFPDIRSEYNFDCQTGKNSFYVRPPSKFYLYTHGIIDFLVESEINCNFRYGKKEPENQFYNGQPLSKWLQEVNVPIIQPNTFFYNNTYSFPVSNTPYKKLDRTYDKDIWAKRALKPNAWIWSEKDVNENSMVDPWLIFKPLSFWEDKTSKGKLIDLRSIESDQFFGRYEDQLQLFNQANNVADAINNQNKELGTGFLYSRPITFKKADLGFAGTQNTDFVSTPEGHYWVDAKRGRIFQVDQNGGNMEVISESVGRNPSGMKQWFREHLPFKILKQFPQIDVDNKFKGLGMNIWYDDRNNRVFFTKRDYKVVNTECLKYEESIGFYTDCDEIETSCPDGYTFNEETQQCELTFNTLNLCPVGYTYNELAKTCTLIETLSPSCVCTADVVASNASICSGSNTSVSLSTTSLDSVTFTWTVAQSGVTGAVNGSGSIINQILNNSGTTNGTAVYTITPMETISGCVGTPIDVIVTVKPIPNVIATPSSLSVSDGDLVEIGLTSGVVGTTFTWAVANIGTSGAIAGSGNTISQVITGEGTTTYTVTPTNNGCEGETIDVVVTVSGITISNTTQINIWFDNSGSMNTTLTPLQTMVTTVLKPCLLPAYNNDSALYDARVQVLNFNSGGEPIERYIKLLAKTSTVPEVTKVINLTFADESNVYGAAAAYSGTITVVAAADINELRTTLTTEPTNSLFGVVFQVSTGGVGTPTYPGFKTFVTNVHTGVAPFTGINGLSDKSEIGYELDVVPASTPEYYANLVVTALNNLGFSLAPC